MNQQQTFLFLLLAFFCFLTSGCQRMASVVVENQAPYPIYVYDADDFDDAGSLTLLGKAEPATKTRLERNVIIRGGSPVQVVVKNSNGKTLRKIIISLVDGEKSPGSEVFFTFSD